MEPLVSICLLTYNHEKYIEDTLNSIINQTYSNIELIILDDASDDSTISIINKYRDRLDKRFRNVDLILHEINSGNIPANVNEQIKKSKGEYIKGFAGDDVMFTSCVETLVSEFMKHSNVDVIHANGFVEKEDYRYGDEPSWILFRDFVPIYDSERFFLNEMYGNHLLAPSTMIKRNIFDEYGLYDESLGYEDYEYWLRLLSKHKNFYYVDKPLVAYRRTDNSVTHITEESDEAKFLKCIVSDMEIRKKYLGFLSEEQRRLVFEDAYYQLLKKAESIGADKCANYLYEKYGKDNDLKEKSVSYNHISQNKMYTEIEILSSWVDNYEYVRNVVLSWKGQRLAIYGYARLGKRLYKLLVANDINVDYIIDRKGDSVLAPVSVYSLDEELNAVDIIVVTVIGAFNDILCELRKKTDAYIIDLMDVVYRRN